MLDNKLLELMFGTCWASFMGLAGAAQRWPVHSHATAGGMLKAGQELNPVDSLSLPK